LLLLNKLSRSIARVGRVGAIEEGPLIGV